MSIKVGDNFSYKGKKTLDDRMFFNTLTEMKNYPYDFLPDTFIATCKETGKLYIYNSKNTIDLITGKWRENLSNVDIKIAYDDKTGDLSILSIDADKIIDSNDDTEIKSINGRRIEDVNGRIAVNNLKKELDDFTTQSISESIELAKYGKQVIAQAITKKGVITSNTDSFDIMAMNIENIIITEGTSQGDSYATNFLRNKKILWQGDSFFSGIEGNTAPSYNIDNTLGTISKNIAVPGSALVHSDPNRNIVTLLQREITNYGIDEYDIILLSAGGNDIFYSLNDSNISIGHFIDKNTLLSDKTIIGQLQRLFNMLEEHNKLKNLLYVLGAYSGNDANFPWRSEALFNELFPMLKAYKVNYIYYEGAYGINETVNGDGMHPLDITYKNKIFPKLVPYMIFTYIKASDDVVIDSGGNSGGETTPPISSNLSVLKQGSLTSNGVKIDIKGKKITFIAQKNIPVDDGVMFLVTGDSLQGGKVNSDFSNRLTDTFFNCKSGDKIELRLANITGSSYNMGGYVSIVGQSTNAQATCFPTDQSNPPAIATLAETSLGIICGIGGMNIGDTASYEITVFKNGIEIGNVYGNDGDEEIEIPSTPSDTSLLKQGTLTSNGVKIDISNNKVTFTALENIIDGDMFLVTGDSIEASPNAEGLSHRLTDRFFNCGNGDNIEISITNRQNVTNRSGYVSLIGQNGATQLLIFPQDDNDDSCTKSTTLSEDSVGIICAMGTMNEGDVSSYDIIVKKNGVELKNLSNNMIIMTVFDDELNKETDISINLDNIEFSEDE